MNLSCILVMTRARSSFFILFYYTAELYTELLRIYARQLDSLSFCRD